MYHSTSSPTPSTSTSSTLHPLVSSSLLADSSLPQSAASSRAPSPGSTSQVRSRRPVSNSLSSTSAYLSSGSPASSWFPRPPHPIKSTQGIPLEDADHDERDERDGQGEDPYDSADVTRPSLRKATKDVLGLAGQGSARPLRDPDLKGKQKSRSHGDNAPERDRDREVVVHKVLKTDTIASVTLQYGITQQALRKANRLWATDPIHLRSTILIPLDECNLPSSSFGLERIAREENGDITVWKREYASSSSAKPEGLHAVADRSRQAHAIVSPIARRLPPPYSMDTCSTSLSQPPSATSDFLAIWDDTPASSSRPSLDSIRSSTTSSLSSTSRPSFSPQIPSRLSSNSQPYSSSTTSLDLTQRVAPLTDQTKLDSSETPLSIDTPQQTFASASLTPSSSSLVDVSAVPDAELIDSLNDSYMTISKRTLKVEKLPASQLSFFASPNPHNTNSPLRPHSAAAVSSGRSRTVTSSSATSSASSSFSYPSSQTVNGQNGNPPFSRSTTSQERDREGFPQASTQGSQDLFFGPLAESLTTTFPSLRHLNKYLTLQPSSSEGVRAGPIALPLSRTGSPNRSPKTAAGRGSGSGWGWNLDFFGEEREQASLLDDPRRTRRERRRTTKKPDPGAREVGIPKTERADPRRLLDRNGVGRGSGGGGGSGSQRRTSEIGLEQVTSSPLRKRQE